MVRIFFLVYVYFEDILPCLTSPRDRSTFSLYAELYITRSFIKFGSTRDRLSTPRAEWDFAATVYIVSSLHLVAEHVSGSCFLSIRINVSLIKISRNRSADCRTGTTEEL